MTRSQRLRTVLDGDAQCERDPNRHPPKEYVLNVLARIEGFARLMAANIGIVPGNLGSNLATDTCGGKL